MSGSRSGALVISLDFELHWGVRDTKTVDGPYRRSLLGGRSAVPAILGIFEQYQIRATWGVVGRLFARSRAELERYRPSVLPDYLNPKLSPWDEEVGDDEASDPFHFAPSLIEKIVATSGQEVGTHTFSHFYCLEPGQTTEAFASDLDAAKAIAESYDLQLRSIIFPRNQRNPAYDAVLAQQGIVCYRGNASGWMHIPEAGLRPGAAKRVGRLVDMFNPAGESRAFRWDALVQPTGLVDVPASFFLRPVSGVRLLEEMRFDRIRRSLRSAAERGEILHLWWHPHNFGADLKSNIEFLSRLLDEFSELRMRFEMRSLGMADVASVLGVAS